MKTNMRVIKKQVVDHIPEILTIGAVASELVSNYLFVKGAKKEAEDGDKKHYIPGAIASGISVVCIVASNRVSNAQKVSLVAGMAALASQNKKERELLVKKGATEEELKEVDLGDTSNYSEGHASGKVHYWCSQFGIAFWAYPKDIEHAASLTNKQFDSDGTVSLEDILERLHAFTKVNEERSKNITWSYDWESDGEQRIVFEQTPTTFHGEPCVRLRLFRQDSNDPLKLRSFD